MFTLSEKKFIPEVFRAATDYVWRKHSLIAALPDLIIEDDGVMYVTAFTHGADVVDVSSNQYFSGVLLDDIPARFRGSHDYAAKNGYSTGYPNFHQAIHDPNIGVVYGTNLISASAVEYRDVLASEFGDIAFDDIPRRIRTTGNYAVRNGFAWGIPNFHQAQKENGIVYGTFLFRSEYVHRIQIDVESMFGSKPDWDVFFSGGHPLQMGISVDDFREKLKEVGEAVSDGLQDLGGYIEEKITQPLVRAITSVFESTKDLIQQGNVSNYGKKIALEAASTQKNEGTSKELCSEAVGNILIGVALALQAATPAGPNPYAIVLGASAKSLAKWACHEIYKET